MKFKMSSHKRRKSPHTSPSRKRSKKSLSENKNNNPPPKSNSGGISVEKSRLMCRRYEEFHDHFLTYAQIEAFLTKTKNNNPNTVDLVTIGQSSQGRAIYVVSITADHRSATDPKFATFIEAGLNGQDCFAVSNALYMIDYLSKHPCHARLMDYIIAPCGNPDAYDQFVRSKEESKDPCNLKRSPSKGAVKQKPCQPCSGSKNKNGTIIMDLTLNFPVILGADDLRNIPTENFVEKIKSWKEKYVKTAPETLALIKTIHSCLFAIKLFISLREGGEAVCYPYGFTGATSDETPELKEVARRGKCAIQGRNFQFGSVYDLQGLTYGHLIDFLKLERGNVKYMYHIQVFKKTAKYDEKAELQKLMTYGCQIMECVKRMTAAVFKACTPLSKKYNTETVT